MKIKILKDTRCAGEFVAAGDVIDVGADGAKNLIRMGKAEIHVPAAKEQPAKVEKAEKEDEPEKVEAPAKVKKPRKAKSKDSQ